MLTPREQFLVDVGIATFARRLEKLAAAGPGVIGLVDAQFGNANSPASTIQLKGRGIPAMAGFAPKPAPSTQGPATPAIAPPTPAAAGKAALNTKTAGTPIWLQGKELAGTGPKTQQERSNSDLAQPQPDHQLPRLDKEAADDEARRAIEDAALRARAVRSAPGLSPTAVDARARQAITAAESAVSRRGPWMLEEREAPGGVGLHEERTRSVGRGAFLDPLRMKMTGNPPGSGVARYSRYEK